MDECEREMIGTIASELEQRGEKRGRLQALVFVLERRFGPLPSELLKQIGEAKAAQLETWLGRAVDAATLEAVLEQPSKH